MELQECYDGAVRGDSPLAGSSRSDEVGVFAPRAELSLQEPFADYGKMRNGIDQAALAIYGGDLVVRREAEDEISGE